MKDVRDELVKLRARLFVRTGSHEVYDSLLEDLWDTVVVSIEDDRAVNGGEKRYGLRTPAIFRPPVPLMSVKWEREMRVKNYVGWDEWLIRTDRVFLERLEEWSAPSAYIERRIAELRRGKELRTQGESPPLSSSS